MFCRFKTKIKTFFKRVFCSHQYTTNLIFSSGFNSHRVIKSCIKCGKSQVVFKGNRLQWYRFMGMLP